MSEVTSRTAFLLWHVHHVGSGEPPGSAHFEGPEDFWVNEKAGDDVKLLGVYSTEKKAQDRIRRAVRRDGFREEPTCFHIDEYEVDRDCWSEGFISA